MIVLTTTQKETCAAALLNRLNCFTINTIKWEDLSPRSQAGFLAEVDTVIETVNLLKKQEDEEVRAYFAKHLEEK